jgi:HEAT repeat protein
MLLWLRWKLWWGDSSTRRRAVQTLGRIGGRTAAALLLARARGDRDTQVRADAIKALAEVDLPAAMGIARAALQSPDQYRGYLGEAVAAVLVRKLPPGGLRFLIELAADDHSIGRAAGWQALGRYAGWERTPEAREAVPYLIGKLEDRQPYCGSVAEAADLLGRIGDRRAVERLIRALRFADPSVRREAAKALGLIGDTRALEPLKEIVKDRRDPRFVASNHYRAAEEAYSMLKAAARRATS